ncbi:unnamed protein product [Ectocarpus sp. CCAP 1310/34]|nr:unnamed protein product [Ectocarpus sp. CCAP 1310/34]
MRHRRAAPQKMSCDGEWCGRPQRVCATGALQVDCWGGVGRSVSIFGCTPRR